MWVTRFRFVATGRWTGRLRAAQHVVLPCQTRIRTTAHGAQ